MITGWENLKTEKDRQKEMERSIKLIEKAAKECDLDITVDKKTGQTIINEDYNDETREKYYEFLKLLVEYKDIYF